MRLSLGYQTVRTSAKYETATGVILSFAEALVLIGAAFEVINGRLSIGGLFGFLSAFWKIINAGSSLITQFSTLIKIIAQVDRLLAFENLPKDAADELACSHDTFRLETVAVDYGPRTVLRDINLAAAPGERLLILGPNGSGKSTLANVITGFVRPSAGMVERPKRGRITALLTPFHFVPGTLKENVDFENLPREKQELFGQLTQTFDLAGKCDTDIATTFSEGEKKKGQIIMVLLKDADVCLFDEPLAHLDVSSKRKAMDIIQRHTEGKSLAVIMHGDEEFHSYFDRVIHLENGIQTGRFIEIEACGAAR